MRYIPVSPIDFLFSNGSYPIEFFFFFRNRLNFTSLLKALDSLREDFFPFFCRYDSGILSENTCALDQYSGEFQLNEEIDLTVSSNEIFERFKGVAEPENNNLFFLRIIQFRNGTALIPHLKHIAGDGYSYFSFLMDLAGRVRGEGSNTIIKNTYIRNLSSIPLHSSAVKPKAIPEKSTDITIIRHSKQSVKENIRQIALETGITVSSNDLLTAVSIKKILNTNGYAGKTFSVTIPVDVRNKVKEYGRNFIGNGLLFHLVTFDSEYLKKSPETEIALAIRKSMPEISVDSYKRYQKELSEKINAGNVNDVPVYNPENGCLVTNLSQLPSSKLDFGTGTPDLIIPMITAENSALILSDNADYILRISV